jgi:DUF4097 and DUF4098 domain-containing protein YvlB
MSVTNNIRRSAMRKILWFSALLLILIPIWLGCEHDHSVNSNCDYYAEEPFSFTVDLEDQTRFRLMGITGTVEMTGQAGSRTVTVSGVKRVESSSVADARAHLDDIELKVENSEDELFVRTEYRRDAKGRNYVVDYTITLPSDLEVRASNQTGKVFVEEMENNVRANVVTGGVTLDRVTGDADIDVTTGNVTLKLFSGSANVDLITGNLSCEAFLPPRGVLDLKTITGRMDVHIPESTSAELTARVSTGKIDIWNLPLQDPSISSNYVSGQLHDGNGTITLEVITGQMSVSGFLD